MGYLTRTSKYPESISLCDLNHVMSMNNIMTIDAEMPQIDNGCSLDKEFTKLICMNPSMLLYQTNNQVDSCYSYVHICVT